MEASNLELKERLQKIAFLSSEDENVQYSLSHHLHYRKEIAKLMVKNGPTEESLAFFNSAEDRIKELMLLK